MNTILLEKIRNIIILHNGDIPEEIIFSLNKEMITEGITEDILQKKIQEISKTIGFQEVTELKNSIKTIIEIGKRKLSKKERERICENGIKIGLSKEFMIGEYLPAIEKEYPDSFYENEAEVVESKYEINSQAYDKEDMLMINQAEEFESINIEKQNIINDLRHQEKAHDPSPRNNKTWLLFVIFTILLVLGIKEIWINNNQRTTITQTIPKIEDCRATFDSLLKRGFDEKFKKNNVSIISFESLKNYKRCIDTTKVKEIKDSLNTLLNKDPLIKSFPIVQEQDKKINNLIKILADFLGEKTKNTRTQT